MTEKYFVDTNVWVYARDASEPRKRERAIDWLTMLSGRRRACLSVQVVNEFYAVLRTKFADRISLDDARRETQALLDLAPLPLESALVLRAWSLQDRFSLSWWDSLIIAAAQAQECTLVLSEDLQDGQEIDGLRIANPFKHEPGEGLSGIS
jgi:predicted nucleic acid-binding protein